MAGLNRSMGYKQTIKKPAQTVVYINNQLVEFTSSYSVCWNKLVEKSSN
jgi:hypothetical protein